MSGQILSQALAKLSGHDLRLVYALLCKTNIFNLISTKTKDLLSSDESNHFSKHLEEEAKKLLSKTDEEIRLSLFLELTKIAQLKGGRYDLKKEIEDKCQEIVDWAFNEFQKKNKEFQQYYKEKDIDKLEAMIHWQMNQVFKELDLKLIGLSEYEQDQLAEKVLEFVNSLPSDQQEKIKEKLGVQEISNKVVKNIMAQSGASILFATIVEVSGFAFYTTATSMLAAFMGFFGITLPFGAYTTLTSTIAFLANPLFILPLILGGGVLLVNHQNKSLRKRLVPIVLMQISLPYLTNPEISYHDLSVISNEWIPKFDNYKQLYHKLKLNQEEQRKLNREISALNTKLQAREADKKEKENKISAIKEKLKEKLKNDKGRPYIEGLTNQLHSMQNQIVGLEEQIKIEKRSSTGFWRSIKTALKTSNYQLEIASLKRRMDQTFEQMVEIILQGKLEYANEQFGQVNSLQLEIQELLQQISTLQIQLSEKNKELSNLRIKERTIRNEIKNKEIETYGLEHIVLN
jgi:hypothetical protein